MKAKLTKGFNWLRANARFIMPVLLAVVFLAVSVGTTMAAPAPGSVTLELDPEALTDGLFTGANIIIAALGAIMFLMAGFKLGGMLLRGIIDAVGGIRF